MTKPKSNAKAPAYPKAIAEVLFTLRETLLAAFADELVGIYLLGSLTYGDFKPERSDIDVVVITRGPLAPIAMAKLIEMHQDLATRFPAWSKRLEVSYTPLAMLQEPAPPGARPYWGDGRFYPAAVYGNEWIINNYLLIQHGLPLFGPPFALICPPITVRAVQAACRRDLLDEWAPRLADDAFFADPHTQSYLVLNLCRILHTLLRAEAASKSASAAWVAAKFPQWQELIAAANDWTHGLPFAHTDASKSFLEFTLAKAATANPAR